MAAATATEPETARNGAELVAVVERFQLGVLMGAFATVALAGAGAVLLLPTRDSAGDVSLLTPTVVATILLVLAMPFAIWQTAPLYWRLRRHPLLLAFPVALAAALVSYPLRSELWWPGCALLMLVAVLVGFRRAVLCAGVALLANLAAHALAGDLGTTPAVSILGLWIGLPFWSATAAIFTEQISRHLVRLHFMAPRRRRAPLRVATWREAGEEREPPQLPPGTTVADRLTTRQLEVVALLVDGYRYAEVGELLAISVTQVRRHVSGAIDRLGVANANELVAVAAADGLGAKPG